jgi:hypothetical protein
LHFGRATARHFAWFLSCIPYGIGFFIQPFTRKHQTLHDLIVRSVVLVRPDKKRVTRWIIVLCVIIGLMEASLLVSLPSLMMQPMMQQRIALDKESKAYADSAIPAIVSTWSEKELLDRASPEFKQSTEQFRSFSSLGPLQKCEPAQGQATMSATAQTGKVISGQYTAKATFEKGEASIKLGLIKHGDQWQIQKFVVDSPALVPP